GRPAGVFPEGRRRSGAQRGRLQLWVWRSRRRLRRPRRRWVRDSAFGAVRAGTGSGSRAALLWRRSKLPGLPGAIAERRRRYSVPDRTVTRRASAGSWDRAPLPRGASAPESNERTQRTDLARTRLQPAARIAPILVTLAAVACGGDHLTLPNQGVPAKVEKIAGDGQE